MQVVVDAAVDPSGEGTVLVAEFALGVVRGEDAQADQPALRDHHHRVDGLTGCPFCRAVQGEQGEGCLIDPVQRIVLLSGLVVVGEGLQFAQGAGDP